MIIGEKMTEGGVLYRDLWSNVGPFSATIYWLINEIFSRSQIAYMAFAFLFVLFQSIKFNQVLLRNEAFSQPTYVPAFVYGILALLSFDFMTLSPQLMGATFIIPALDILFAHINSREKLDEKIQYMGILLVTSTLFYFPYFVFLPGFFLVLVIFTGTVVRRFFLIMYGFLLPLTLVGIYFWFHDGLTFFLNQFILREFVHEKLELMQSSSLLVICLPIAIFLLFSLIKLFGRTRYTNFQISLIQVILILFLFAGVGFWISPFKPPHALLIFLPFIAFMFSHLFMLIRSRVSGEIAFAFYLVGFVVWNFGTVNNFSPTARIIDYSNFIVKETRWDSMAEGKRVLVLSSNKDMLKGAKLATPFLSWRLSEPVFANPQIYQNVVLVYKHLKLDPPDLIIDPHGYMGPMLEKIPELKSKYVQTGDHWIRRE